MLFISAPKPKDPESTIYQSQMGGFRPYNNKTGSQGRKDSRPAPRAKRPRTVSQYRLPEPSGPTANTIIFSPKQNRLPEPSGRSKQKKTGSRSRANKSLFQTKNRLPEPNGPLQYTCTILGFKQNPDPGPYTQTKIFLFQQNRLPEPNGTQTRQNKRDRVKWITCTNNTKKRRWREKKGNQKYALGTRGTLNMLNKVLVKLARKPQNPNAWEKTRKVNIHVPHFLLKRENQDVSRCSHAKQRQGNGRDTSGTTVDRVSTECRPTINRLSTDYRPLYRLTVDRVSTEYRPTVDRVSTEYRPSVDRVSTAISTAIWHACKTSAHAQGLYFQ